MRRRTAALARRARRADARPDTRVTRVKVDVGFEQACRAFAGRKVTEGPGRADDLQTAGKKDRYAKACLFVDNAGSDVVLGMLVLARELLKAGTRVVLAANELPNINDVTADELALMFTPLADRPSVEDAILRNAAAEGNLSVVSTGSDLPVIDLSDLSPDFVQSTSDCDLIVLEGMGRGIETNLLAQFRCDALNIGMIKHVRGPFRSATPGSAAGTDTRIRFFRSRRWRAPSRTTGSSTAYFGSGGRPATPERGGRGRWPPGAATTPT